MNLRLLIALFFLCVSCHNDDPQPEAPVCMEDNSIEGMKKWYFFKPGSTWDYVEQNSGAVDHVTAVDYIEEYTTSGNYYLYSEYYSSFYDWPIVYQAATAGTIDSPSNPECKSRLIQHYFQANQYSFVYPGEPGDYYNLQGWRPQELLIEEAAGSSFVFPKVIKWVTKNYEMQNNQIGISGAGFTELWMAEGVGVIRIFQPGKGVDWRLTSYNIVE